MSQILHEAGYPGRLPQHWDQRGGRMENNLFYKIRDIRIPIHAIWIMQRTGGVPAMDHQCPYRRYRHVLHRLSGRHTHRFQNATRTPKRRQQHPRGNTKIRDEGQTIQMRISLKRNRIPRIYHPTRGGQDRLSQDTRHLGLHGPQENKRNSMLPRVLQLLPTIYRRL